MFAKPLPGIMDDPFHPLSQGCVCHLLLNEGSGSLTYDVSGHGNNGKLWNIAPNAQNSGWGGSKFGGGVSFDGSNDWIDCGTDASINFLGDKSISFWMYMHSKTSYRIIITNTIGLATQNAGFEIYYNGVSDYLTLIVGNGAPAGHYYDAHGTSLNTGQWYHVVMVQNSTGLYGYVNGEEYASDTTSSGSEAKDNYPLRIGTRNVSLYYPFDGHIDDVRLFNRALNKNEREQLYHNPFCNSLKTPIWKRHVLVATGGRSYGYIF